jgi:hypothetical protein
MTGTSATATTLVVQEKTMTPQVTRQLLAPKPEPIPPPDDPTTPYPKPSAA